MHMICIIILVTLLSTAGVCANASNTAHLKYFGYYHSDGFWEKAPGHLPQIAKLKNSNIAMINCHHNKEEMQILLDICNQNNMQAFVSAYDCFFEWNPKRTGNVRMFDDWKVRWQALKDSIKRHENSVIGFYFDEPYWNGVREEDFRLATRTIRREFPNKRVFACLTACELDPARWKPDLPEVSETYYEFCTDGAYDFYSSWDEAYFAKLLDKLKSRMTKNQDLWIIPWAFTRETPDSSSEVLLRNFKGVYKLAQNEPRCVGLIPFSFSSGDKADWGHGCNRMFDPNHKTYSRQLKDAHIRIGRSIILGVKLTIE